MNKTIGRTFLYGIAFIWIIVLVKFIGESNVIATANNAEELGKIWQMVDCALNEQNATDQCYTVKLVARSEQRTKEEQTQLLSHMAKLVEKQEQIDINMITVKEERRKNGVSLDWEVSNSDFYFSAQYLDMKEDYVVLTMEYKGDFGCVKSYFYMTCFGELIEMYDLTGIPCMEIIAYLPKMLSFTERNIVSENILYMCKAKEIQGIRGSDLYTIYGYSKAIPTCIHVAEQYFNVNISFEFIEHIGQTKLQIGIPIMQ